MTERRMMVKALSTGQVRVLLSGSQETVGGFVVEEASVAWARRPADVFEALGLGFEGSPFRPDQASVDLLVFPPYATMRFENATGGIDTESRARTNGPFLDRPPFTGTGFVAVPGHIVPLWWLRPTRLAPGSVIVRVHDTGMRETVALYPDVATGWLVNGAPLGAPRYPPRRVGTLAAWNGEYPAADLVHDGTAVALAFPRPVPGCTQTAPTVWGLTVDRSEVESVFELDAVTTVGGLDFRVLDDLVDADGTRQSRLVYIGHDADAAEHARLVKVDAACYELIAESGDLGPIVTTRLTIPGPARPTEEPSPWQTTP